MTRHPSSFRVFLVCATLLALVACPLRAHADDGKDKDSQKDFVSELTAEEVSALEQRLPKAWSEYSAREQQRIARGVVRLRNMSPEQRKALEEKIRKYRETRRDDPDLREKLRPRFDDVRDLRPHDRREWGRLQQVAKAAAMVAFEAIDPEQAKQLQKWGLNSRSVGMPFLRMVHEAAIKPFVDGAEMDVTELPERYRERFTKALADVGDSKQKQARVASGYVMMRTLVVLEQVDKPLSSGPSGQTPTDRRPDQAAKTQYYRDLGKAVQSLWPEAFANAVARIEGLTSADEARALVRQYADRHDRGPGSKSRRSLMMLVWQLIDAPKLLGAAPDDTEAVERLSIGLLHFALVKVGIPKADVETALAETDAGRRKKAVTTLLKKHGLGPHSRARQGGGNRRGAGPGPGGNKRTPK